MNEEAMCYVGNLANDVSHEIVEELFIQVGPLKSINLKKAESHNYALIEFEDEDSVPFAIEVLDGIALFNKPISVKPRNNTKQEEIWKRTQSEQRRSNSSRDLNRSSQSLPDSRRRDHNGEFRHHQETLGSTPRSRDSRQERLPLPPTLTTNVVSSYITPQSNQPQLGYTRSFDRVDRWHTPPSREHVTPRIPREYDDVYQQTIQDRSHRYSRDFYRDERRDAYQSRQQRDDYQNNGRQLGQEGSSRNQRNYRDDRRSTDSRNRRF